MRPTRRALLAAATLAAPSGLSLARAADPAWPARPVRIVVPFAAGGSGDITARLVGRQMQQATGQSFVVENLPGGNGTVGTLAVLNAPADGHTLLLGTTTTMSASHAMMRNPPYDAARDFVVVAPFGITAGCLMVPADSPYRTVQELVAHIRANPGRLNSGWFNGSSRIPAALLKRVAGLEFEEVAYKAVGNAISDLRTGTIQFVFIDMVAADAHLRSGAFRALAVTMGRRVARWPDLPAMNELYEGFEMGGFLGIALRSATPAPLQAEINRRVVAAVATQEVSQRLREMIMEPVAFDLEESAAYAARERAKWGRIVRMAGIEPE
jgi:tripartite-type tricarboxylate transporter receptor subunit TctC